MKIKGKYGSILLMNSTKGRMKLVIIPASKVAQAIGRNKYCTPDEFINDTLRKISPSAVPEYRTQAEQIKKIITKSDAAAKLINKAQLHVSKNSNDALDMSSKLNLDLSNLDTASLNKDDQLVLSQHIRKTIFTNHGHKHEEVAAKFAKQSLVEDDTLYKLKICTIGQLRFEVWGSIDRIQENDDGTTTLVEIKNRVRRLFRHVTDYEAVQCQVYMQLVDLDQCKLIERYNHQQRYDIINRDRVEWSEAIKPDLVKVCEKIESMYSYS